MSPGSCSLAAVEKGPQVLSTHAGDTNVSWQSCKEQLWAWERSQRNISSSSLISPCPPPLWWGPPAWQCWYLHHALSLGPSPTCWVLLSVPGWAGHWSLHTVPPLLVETPSPRSQQADPSEILAAVAIRKPKWSRSNLQEMVELFLHWRGLWLQ